MAITVTTADLYRPAKVVVTSAGVAYVLCMVQASYALRMYKVTTSSTLADTLAQADIFDGSDFCNSNDMVIDSGDTIHIMCGSNIGSRDNVVGFDFMYVQFDTSTDTFGTAIELFSTAQNDTSHQLYGQLALDSNDDIYAIVEDRIKFMGVNYYQVSLLKYTGTWGADELVNTVQTDGCSFPALMVGPSNVIEAIWRNVTTNTGLHYRARNGTWGTEGFYTGNTWSAPPQVGITSGGTVFRVTAYVTDPWHIYINGVDSTLDAGSYIVPGISTDTVDNAYVIYSENSSKDIRIIVHNGSSWGSPTTLHAGTYHWVSAFHQYHSQHKQDSYIGYVYGNQDGSGFPLNTYYETYDVSIPAEGFPVSQLPRLRHISHIVSR